MRDKPALIDMAAELGQAIESFVKNYSHQRYHQALGNATLLPMSFLAGRMTSWPEQRQQGVRHCKLEKSATDAERA